MDLTDKMKLKKTETVPLMYKEIQIGTVELDYKNNKVVSKITAPIEEILKIIDDIDNES